MKKNFGRIIITIILLLLLFVGVNSAFVIKENQYGIVKEFGKIEKVISEP